MKSAVLFVNFFLVSFAAVAQKDIPAFGKIDKADLEMKDCDFDKGAAAVKLIDWGNTYYEKGNLVGDAFKTVFERRTRIKILKEAGMAEANIKIPFYASNNEEKITRLNAYTYNIDEHGNVDAEPVKKNSIFVRRVSAKYSEAIIAFPNVKTGSVIEYEYTMERQTMGHLKDWYFQERIPVRYSEYQLIIPQTFRFTVQPSVIDPMEQKRKVIYETLSGDQGALNVKSIKTNYIMHNLQGIKDEPYMGSARDYMQRLEFQLKQIDFGNNNIADLRIKWSDIIQELIEDEDFGVLLDEGITSAKPLIEEALKITDQEARMKYLFENLRTRMNWDQEESIYSNKNLNKAWETKEGNAAAINLLLVKLLSDAGIKASPVLLSTRDNGMVSAYYPFINQFNTVLAYVTINNNYFVLDATDKISNYTLTPEKIANTKGFIVEGENGQWKEIPSGKNKYKLMTAVHGEIDDAGILKGDGLVNCSGYARTERVQNWMKDKAQFKEIYFTNPYPGFKIEDLVVNNTDADSLPLEQKVKFSAVLNSSGDYKYFGINLFSGLDKNPFVTDERVADIDFGYQQDYTLFGSYTIPQDYVFDGLPQNISMIMPDTSIIFTRSLEADDNLLNVKISVEFKHTLYPATNYPEFKEFYKKLFARLNEQVVIKKKTT
jgi:hypothetical protein